MAHMYTELQMIKEALQKYQKLIEAGFSKSTYIISQIAVAYHNIRGSFLQLFSPSEENITGTDRVKRISVLYLRYRPSFSFVQRVEGAGSLPHRQHGHLLQPALCQSEYSDEHCWV